MDKQRFPVDIQCRCGCGERITEVSKATYYRLQQGRKVGYLPGHRHRGSANPRWNGGEAKAHDAYILVARPNHPNARKSGYILEHRLVMSEHLGRPLEDYEIVHHKNGDKADNRIENLEIVSRRKHMKMHDPNEHRRVEYVPKKCDTCGKEFMPDHRSNYHRNRFCSRECIDLKGENHWKAKLTEEQVREIYALKDKVSKAKIAKRFGVSRAQIKKIHRKEAWRHLWTD